MGRERQKSRGRKREWRSMRGRRRKKRERRKRRRKRGGDVLMFLCKTRLILSVALGNGCNGGPIRLKVWTNIPNQSYVPSSLIILLLLLILSFSSPFLHSYFIIIYCFLHPCPFLHPLPFFLFFFLPSNLPFLTVTVQ